MAVRIISPSAETPQVEFSIERDTILAEVAAAARACDGKTTQTILTHLLLDASASGSVTISGTDHKRSIHSGFGAQVKTAGAVALPAQKFLNYRKLLPAGPVRIKGLPMTTYRFGPESRGRE